jgi:hypothetical protein
MIRNDLEIFRRDRKILSFNAYYSTTLDNSRILNYCHAELAEAMFVSHFFCLDAKEAKNKG